MDRTLRSVLRNDALPTLSTKLLTDSTPFIYRPGLYNSLNLRAEMAKYSVLYNGFLPKECNIVMKGMSRLFKSLCLLLLCCNKFKSSSLSDNVPLLSDHHFKDHNKTKQILRLYIITIPSNQNCDLTHVWTSTQNISCQSFSFRVMKNCLT